MDDVKQELVEVMNTALELEHRARIQYLAHAEKIAGLKSEPVIARIKEIAGDEKEHEDMFREMIGAYLGGVPVMTMKEAHDADGVEGILNLNLKDEKDAIDFYKQIYKKAADNKDKLQYEFESLEHMLRHIIIDEQEHVSELSQLLGK